MIVILLYKLIVGCLFLGVLLGIALAGFSIAFGRATLDGIGAALSAAITGRKI